MTDSTYQSLILIVDDTRTIRVLFSAALQDVGFRVLEAESGEQAIKTFSEQSLDAIILDVEMAGINGFETCKRIRQLPNGDRIPIVIVTGLADIDSINKAFQVGATDFITKPVNFDLIGNRMHYVVRNSNNLNELIKSKAVLLEAKENIQKLNDELEHRVIDRTKQLQQTNEELSTTLVTLKETQAHLIESEKLASLGSLVAGIAHEINTPLGVCLTAISHMNEKLLPVIDAVTQKELTQSQLNSYLKLNEDMVKIITTNIRHAVELIKSFKQVSLDQATETRSTINLKEFIEETLFSLRPMLEKNKITIQFTCPSDLIIDNYPTVLFQIIAILTMNVIKHAYSPDQGGVITLTVTTDDNTIVIVFADKGKGIMEENIKKIFDPFFTTKRSEGSVGLGLHIAYNQIAKILQGSVQVKSRPNIGTEFTVTFPKVLKPVL